MRLRRLTGGGKKPHQIEVTREHRERAVRRVRPLVLRDPDDNGVELYWDRPQEKWPRTPDGKLAMFTRHLDLMGLLAAAGEPPKAEVADAAEDEVRDL